MTWIVSTIAISRMWRVYVKTFYKLNTTSIFLWKCRNDAYRYKTKHMFFCNMLISVSLCICSPSRLLFICTWNLSESASCAANALNTVACISCPLLSRARNVRPCRVKFVSVVAMSVYSPSPLKEYWSPSNVRMWGSPMHQPTSEPINRYAVSMNVLWLYRGLDVIFEKINPLNILIMSHKLIFLNVTQYKTW